MKPVPVRSWTASRSLVIGLALVACLCLVGREAGAAVEFTIDLDASQVVAPPAESNSTGTATGTATLSQDAEGNHLQFEFYFDDTFDFTTLGGGGAGGEETAHAFHFHEAPRGENGPGVFGIINVSNDTDGDTVISPWGEGTLVAGEWDSGEGNTAEEDMPDLDDYVPELLAAEDGEEVSISLLFHTEENLFGSIRGQMVPEPGVCPALASGLVTLLVLRRRAARRLEPSPIPS